MLLNPKYCGKYFEKMSSLWASKVNKYLSNSAKLLKTLFEFRLRNLFIMLLPWDLNDFNCKVLLHTEPNLSYNSILFLTKHLDRLVPIMSISHSNIEIFLFH